MEVDTRPTEQYSDIGGLDKQIQVGCSLLIIIQIKNFNIFFTFTLQIAFLFKISHADSYK
jgi:ATP-dependent 26S proteasome regulatory subunit